MNAPQTDARVEAYLAEVRRSVAAVDPGQADDITAEVAEHLQDAAAEAARRGEPFDLERAISELGDPAVIAAAVEPKSFESMAAQGERAPVDPGSGAGAAPSDVADTSPLARLLSSPPVVILTLIATALGLLFSPVVSVIALALVWCSPRWRLGDKIVATVFNPLVLIFGLLFLHVAMLSWSIAVLAAPAVAVYLLLRLRGRDGDRVLAVPRADPNRMPRGGWLHVLDRPVSAAVATGAAPLALLLSTVPALVTGDWAALPVTGAVAAAVLMGGVAVVAASNGWSPSERVIGVVGLAVVGGATALVLANVIAGVPTIEICRPDSCTALPPELRDPAALLDPIARWVLPLVLFAAGWAAARFVPVRSGGPADDEARREASARLRAEGGPAGRRASLIVAGCALLGSAAAPAVVAMSAGSLIGGAIATVALAAWLTAAVIVLRSPRSAAVDRWLAALALPAITWFTLLLLVAPYDPATKLAMRYADVPGLPPFPADVVVPVVAVVAVAVQLAIAIRLIVVARSPRRGPAGTIDGD